MAGHTEHEEAQVPDGQRQNLRLGAQPLGDQSGQTAEQNQSGKAHHQNGEDGLHNGPAGLRFVTGAHGVGHLHRVADAHAGQHAAHQPHGRAVDGDGGGGVLAQNAHHGGVHVADHGAQQLLHNGGPCQMPQNGQTAVL